MPENKYWWLPYDELRFHIGHKIEIIDVWSWQTNSEQGIEIRCREEGCDGCEPLLEADNPHTS
jgi:hypothetical protein